MAKRSKTKKYGIKSVWLLSYLVVFLMPLIVSAVAGTFIYGDYKKQIEERNNIVLTSACNTVDTHLEEIVSSSLQLTNNEYVKNIDRYRVPLTPQEDYYLYEFTREFKTIRGYETIENYSDTFFIYFSSIDYVVKDGVALPKENFYRSHINTKKYTPQMWDSFLRTDYNGAFFSANLFSDENELLFARTLKLGYSDNTEIVAVYKINTDKILDEVNGLYHYEYGSFSLSDSKGNVIIKTNSKTNPSPGRNVSFETESEVTAWKYKYTLPKNRAYGNAYNIFIVMSVLYVICFAIGLWLIGYFTKRNYQPIDNLLTLFSGKGEDGENDEFSYLNKKITESLSHNRELNQEIDSQSKMIREHLLSEILLGHPPVGKRSRTEIEKLQFDIEEDVFTVLIYSCGTEKNEELSMRQFVLTNVTDELLSDDGYRFVSTRKDEDIVYIICTSDNLSEKMENMVKILSAITKKELDFDFFAASGSAQKGVKGIHNSFNEAKRALEYSIASGKTEYVSYSKVASSLKEGYFYTVELETRLVNLIKASEQRKVEQLLDKIFEENIMEDVSLDSVRYLMTELFATVKRLMFQYGHSVEKKCPEESFFMENIFESRDIEKMKNVIRNICRVCCKDVFGMPSHTDDLIGGVMRYVNQNYSNQNLGIRHIGDAFSMNPDYISRRFREHTNKTLNDYIRDIRIEKAKELLRESDELIADIAEMVGFTSYRTFVRVFTEVVGVTPNKYKSMR